MVCRYTIQLRDFADIRFNVSILFGEEDIVSSRCIYQHVNGITVKHLLSKYLHSVNVIFGFWH